MYSACAETLIAALPQLQKSPLHESPSDTTTQLEAVEQDWS